jgi:ADP-L-glycero-D-manno-heptose 6-epimerase
MIIVTGAAGFIGSNLIWQLNRLGVNEILAVDTLGKDDKFLNIRHLDLVDLISPEQFLMDMDLYVHATHIFHLGANSDTTEKDGDSILAQNYEYSKEVFRWCEDSDTAMIYASSAAVYGHGENGFSEDRSSENPLNVYALSRTMFDRWVMRKLPTTEIQIVGLRYFNVFGPQENHKGRMASVPLQFSKKLFKREPLQLFEGSENFLRDFIYVEDVVRVTLFFMENSEFSGIFNCGTGKPHSFKQLAETFLDLWQEDATMETIPFPKDLEFKYQKYTRADISNLETLGFPCNWLSLEEGLRRYINCIKKYGGVLPTPYSEEEV